MLETMSKLALVDITHDIGVITLNKPPVNSLGADLVAAVLEGFARCEAAGARVIILKAFDGAKVWSAGHDVGEIPLDGQDSVTWNTPFEHLLRRVRDCPVPVIGMLHASVWGGACDLAMTCDILVGTPRAAFAITPVKLGVAYNSDGLTHFLGAVPLHVLKEMLFTGHPLSAEDAYRLGVLNRLVEPEKLEEATFEIARSIASRAPLAVRVLKAELRALTAGERMSAHEFEEIQYLRRQAFRSDDLKEGVQAFFAKREPNFKGK